MVELSISAADLDDIRGRTLEERAKLVLMTLGRTSSDIKKAYRKMAQQHHPDMREGDTRNFQLINEAYTLLTGGALPGTPMLADDQRVMSVCGKSVLPLVNKQKKWQEYERWRREHFYWP